MKDNYHIDISFLETMFKESPVREQRKKTAWLRNLLLLPNPGIRSPLGGCSEIVH